MDPVSLASLTVSLLSPLLGKSAEEFAKEVGKDAYTHVKNLKDWLWKCIRGSGEQKVQKVANMFESDPDVFREAMQKTLAEYLRKHPQEAQELTQHVQAAKSAASKYSITIQGGTVYGVSAGDNSTIVQIFGADDSKPRKD